MLRSPPPIQKCGSQRAQVPLFHDNYPNCPPQGAPQDKHPDFASRHRGQFPNFSAKTGGRCHDQKVQRHFNQHHVTGVYRCVLLRRRPQPGYCLRTPPRGGGGAQWVRFASPQVAPTAPATPGLQCSQSNVPAHAVVVRLSEC